jgi:magnesium chelatase family protein
MLASLRTATLYGIEAHPVHVEVDVSNGIPGFNMVGLPDASVRESRDRVRSAIRNSGFDFPLQRITINLAPADLRKAGASFDLPIALGILAAIGAIVRRTVDDWIVLGELSLDGAIQGARGVLPMAVAARRDGLNGLLLPAVNVGEAAVVSGLRLMPVRSLAEAVGALNDPEAVARTAEAAPAGAVAAHQHCDFADVKGQALPKRALEVAAAGGHNVLLVGPPGAGKTMMARRLPGILPPLGFDEALEVTAIHSVAGLLPCGAGLLSERPFRAPHHTISDVALVGGGTGPRPGEISLAHNGVLFLDEMPEFERRALEVLRQPLEDGSVTIARASRTVSFPSRFVLVGAMNPCPCGYRGDLVRECRCTPAQVERYRARISGPLRDRIDLVAQTPAVTVGLLEAGPSGEPSGAIRDRVLRARARQEARFEGMSLRVNADLAGRELLRHCRPDPPGAQILSGGVRRFGLSARAHDRVLKVARTIADLDGAVDISAPHLAESLQYRLDW